MVVDCKISKNIERLPNNFDFIRLLAALQVAISHLLHHLHVDLPVLKKVVNVFPGVPVFFFVSGFLIYKSFSNSGFDGFRGFYINRFLRLYPGLLFCFDFFFYIF